MNQMKADRKRRERILATIRKRKRLAFAALDRASRHPRGPFWAEIRSIPYWIRLAKKREETEDGQGREV